MRFEQVKNTRKVYPFRKFIPAGESGSVEVPLVSHGVVENVKVRFASGENATLHIRPVAVIPQEIEIDLFVYPEGCDPYVSGDMEVMDSDIGVEIENHALIRVYYENTGGLGTADSFLNVDVTVKYFSIVEPENIIG